MCVTLYISSTSAPGGALRDHNISLVLSRHLPSNSAAKKISASKFGPDGPNGFTQSPSVRWNRIDGPETVMQNRFGADQIFARFKLGPRGAADNFHCFGNDLPF